MYLVIVQLSTTTNLCNWPRDCFHAKLTCLVFPRNPVCCDKFENYFTILSSSHFKLLCITDVCHRIHNRGFTETFSMKMQLWHVKIPHYSAVEYIKHETKNIVTTENHLNNVIIQQNILLKYFSPSSFLPRRKNHYCPPCHLQFWWQFFIYISLSWLMK